MASELDDFDFPEGFAAWPREIQSRYLEELHAVYFPPKTRLRVPGTLLAKVKARAEGVGLDVRDGVILALEAWAGA